MTDHLPLEPQLPEADVARLTAQLEAARPVPDPRFRTALGVAVEREALRRRVHARPANLWPVVATLVASGSALLALAAAQL